MPLIYSLLTSTDSYILQKKEAGSLQFNDGTTLRVSKLKKNNKRGGACVPFDRTNHPFTGIGS